MVNLRQFCLTSYYCFRSVGLFPSRQIVDVGGVGKLAMLSCWLGMLCSHDTNAATEAQFICITDRNVSKELNARILSGQEGMFLSDCIIWYLLGLSTPYAYLYVSVLCSLPRGSSWLASAMWHRATEINIWFCLPRSLHCICSSFLICNTFQTLWFCEILICVLKSSCLHYPVDLCLPV